jgi:UDP-glucose 4-epimerase
VKIGPRRPGDPPILVGDAMKAMKELDWKPRYTQLSIIIETAWKWILSHSG